VEATLGRFLLLVGLCLGVGIGRRLASRPSQLALELEYACLEVLVGHVLVRRMLNRVTRLERNLPAEPIKTANFLAKEGLLACAGVG
jgi:hypothetical protein